MLINIDSFVSFFIFFLERNFNNESEKVYKALLKERKFWWNVFHFSAKKSKFQQQKQQQQEFRGASGSSDIVESTRLRIVRPANQFEQQEIERGRGGKSGKEDEKNCSQSRKLPRQIESVVAPHTHTCTTQVLREVVEGGNGKGSGVSLV